MPDCQNCQLQISSERELQGKDTCGYCVQCDKCGKTQKGCPTDYRYCMFCRDLLNDENQKLNLAGGQWREHVRDTP